LLINLHTYLTAILVAPPACLPVCLANNMELMIVLVVIIVDSFVVVAAMCSSPFAFTKPKQMTRQTNPTTQTHEHK
jgi:predicted lysophospholipase L1 biosynthesis ABC-type transport system permease subunit